MCHAAAKACIPKTAVRLRSESLDTLTVQADNAAAGKEFTITATMPAEASEHGLNQAFNPEYLSDCLTAIGGAVTIAIDGNKPAVIFPTGWPLTDDGLPTRFALLMPIRLAD